MARVIRSLGELKGVLGGDVVPRKPFPRVLMVSPEAFSVQVSGKKTKNKEKRD